MNAIHSITILETENLQESGAVIGHPTRKVIACAVVRNPYAGTSAATSEELQAIAELSYGVGRTLVQKCLQRFTPDQKPDAYAKGAIVGTNGQREHGAAAIHLKIGLAMREGIRAGTALIPGVEKQGGPGTSIDIVFGGVGTGWECDAFDSTEVRVPASPQPDEMVIIVGFAVGGRPNARINGVTQEQVVELLAGINADS